MGSKTVTTNIAILVSGIARKHATESSLFNAINGWLYRSRQPLGTKIKEGSDAFPLRRLRLS